MIIAGFSRIEVGKGEGGNPDSALRREARIHRAFEKLRLAPISSP